ncbi:hypothetical protein ACSSS7_008189 [Eimeria intestinalis]
MCFTVFLSFPVVFLQPQEQPRQGESETPQRRLPIPLFLFFSLFEPALFLPLNSSSSSGSASSSSSSSSSTVSSLLKIRSEVLGSYRAYASGIVVKGAPTPLRLLGISRESSSVVELVLSSGEHIRVDAGGSVELRAANGQLLQQLMLPPPSASHQAAAQLQQQLHQKHQQHQQQQQQQQRQQQAEALQQQRRKLLGLHFQLRHLQTQAAALHAAAMGGSAAAAPQQQQQQQQQQLMVQQQQQQQQQQGEGRMRRKLQVFRPPLNQVAPTNLSSHSNSLAPHAWSSSGSNSSSSSSSSVSGGQMARGEEALEGQSGEVCSAAIGGQQHAACNHQADSSTTNSSRTSSSITISSSSSSSGSSSGSSSKGAERASRLFIRRLAREGQREEKPLAQPLSMLPDLPIHPSTALQLRTTQQQQQQQHQQQEGEQQEQEHAAPQRRLLATQAVGGMAIVADALNRVGQAMRKPLLHRSPSKFFENLLFAAPPDTPPTTTSSSIGIILLFAAIAAADVAAPLSYAATMDAAGALFASPLPPVVSAPLHVTSLTPYVSAYSTFITDPYAAAFGCGPLDPGCLYTAIY